MESQLICGPDSHCLPGIEVQLASSMTSGAMDFSDFPSLYWLQSPSAPDGGLGLSVGKVAVGHVPYCISGKGEAVALPQQSLAVSQCFQ